VSNEKLWDESPTSRQNKRLRIASVSSNTVFFKETARYTVWTSRDPIFSNTRDLMINFSDSKDPIFNSRDPIRVPKTP